MTNLLVARPTRTNPKQESRRRTFHHVIGSCAIGETISVTMLAGIRKHCTDPVAKATLTQTLKDEFFYSRFS